jgi:amino acid adenylation domain-containing protein
MLDTDAIDGLSAEEKRALLSRLLMEQAEVSAAVHPLSYGQRSLWFSYQLAPASPAYTITYAGRISGDLDVTALERAVQALVDRHAVLRTTYATRDGEPVQLVHPRWPLQIARHIVGSEERLVDEWLRREANRPFDLQTGPILRLTLLEQAPDEHILIMAVHHIAVDFWAIDVMLDELRLLYAAEHGCAPPTACAERYVDFVDRQLRSLAGTKGQDLWKYWSEQLSGELPILKLPADRVQRVAQTYRGAVIRRTVDKGRAAKLRKLGRNAGATPFMTLLAAYATLLHRYSGQDDILIGSPFSCRERAAMSALVGYVANPVVLRADLHGDPTFGSLLARIRETVLGAIAHQDYPIGLLLDRLHPARDPAHTPLFQTSFVWEQSRRFGVMSTTSTAAPGTAMRMETIHIGQGGAPLDLMMMVGDDEGSLSFALQYNTDLFDDATIERMADHFVTLLDGVIADPCTTLSKLPILTQEERCQQAAWNDTCVPYDAPACLHEIVAATAKRLPDAVAVSCGERDITYAELERRASTLACRLRGLGVGPDSIVPVLLERSEDLVVALLGVLTAGGAFMPLDPAEPPNRIAAMVTGTPGVSVCVTHQRHLDHLGDFAGHRLCLDQPLPAMTVDAFVASPTTSVNLAYVIHTSGSTGAPKGVLNTHGGIRNRLLWMQDTYGLAADDRVLHKTPITFDASVLEIFWPLVAGARVVIAAPEGHKDAAYLVRTITEMSITTIFFVPSLLRTFLAEPGAGDCTMLRRVFSAGEVLSEELVARCLQTLDAELWNEYGPTEAAVGVTYFACTPDTCGSRVPIGRPIANTRIHILDAHLEPVPIGVPGELFISGAGVGRGYVNRPDVTASCFIPDPFSEDRRQVMYRTGDVGRYLLDGTIEYLGRRDDQVKVRGVRIEPGEVEAVLAKHPGVRENAVVTGIDGRGNTVLIAHIEAAVEDAPTTKELRRFLLDRLPAAMLPAAFQVTEALPRTSSGKIDRRALLGPNDSPVVAQQTAFVAPRTRTERILAEIWCEVLDLERVGVYDDFFALGGSSSHSLEVAVRGEAAGLPLTPESVFLCGTIAGLVDEYGNAAEGCVELEQSSDYAETGPDIGAAEVDISASAAAAPIGAARVDTRNTVIESLGAYLPAGVMSTDTVLENCVNPIGIPLERLTGIKSRRTAGDGEFAIDLARRAAEDCLSRSSYVPAEIDLLICCNVSRCDGPGQKFVFEPSTAARLRDECGLVDAIAFDISNACAGMFTGITVADAFLKTGLARHAMVVSGEYITQITETAQKEIEGPMDARLACLTLGDAGAAVVLERGPHGRIGFHDIELATLSRYSSLCVGKASDRAHGGAIMLCDSIAGTVVAVKRTVPYVAAVMQRCGWRPEHCDHIIMHQTSAASIKDGVAAINKMAGQVVAHPGNTIVNLAERGNTASTTHFVALKDHILGNRIKSGDNVVFGITGSGQTVGAALYTLDDLPDRLRRSPNGAGRRPVGLPAGRRAKELPVPPRVRIEGVGTAPAGNTAPRGSVHLAAQAATACLEQTGLDKRALDLIIHAGVYREEFISEPAIAAFVAGELAVNDDVQSPDGPKTLAFDVLNGAVGFLNACHVAVQMIGTGKAVHAMVMASEVENNAVDGGHPRYGCAETGSAVMLGPADGTTGFGHFVFQHYAEYGRALSTFTRHTDGKTWLQIERDPNLIRLYLECIPPAVEELLKVEELVPDEVTIVFAPYLSTEDRTELADRIQIPASRFVDRPTDADPFTSAVPYGLAHAWRQNLVKAGDIGLIVSAGSGIDVGCATYRF